VTTPQDIVRAGADELAWRELIHDDLRSLRTRVAIVTVLAVAALGVAVWALLGDDSGGARRDGASAARVAALARRVDAVQAAVERTPSSAIARLRAEQQALAKQLAAVTDTLQRVQQTTAELEPRVDALERRAATPTPTPTP
jgi:hypothetical protein